MATKSTAEPSNAILTSDQTRTLVVRFDNWKWRKATIFDLDEKTELYRLECHLRKPQIIMESLLDNAPSPQSKGEATFHALSSRIDIRLHDNDIQLISQGLMKDSYTYASPALNGAKMTWQSKSRGRYFNLICLDERAIPVAQVSLGSWSVTKAGTIELAGERLMSHGPEVDEIILTALAMMQQRLTRYAATVAAVS